MMPNMMSGFGGGIRYPNPVSRLEPPMAGPQSPVVAPRTPVMPVGPARPVLGVMHKGGRVKKTGAYLLKKGETVKRAPRHAHKMASVSKLMA